ncbi:hypothetical protein D3C85_1665260 [compost metagenome]
MVHRPVPVELVREATVSESLLQLLEVVLGEIVTLGLFLRFSVASGQFGVEVGFGTAALEALNARLALQLPM